MRVRGIVLNARERVFSGKVRSGLVLVTIAAAVSLSVFGCARPGPGTAKTSEELLAQLQQDRTQIDQTSDTMMKRIDMFNTSRKPGERTLQFSEIFTQDLNSEQRDVLDSMVQEEKDISYKTLLQKIIADRDAIRDLQEKVMHLEQSLPDKFVVAKKGDRHQDLAMAYLTGEAHLDEARAKEHLKQVDVTDELMVGNQVWFFYDPEKDVFRTYVTAGDAGQTPVAMRRAKTKALVKERDTYKKERDTAQEQVVTLEEDKSALQQEMFVKANSLFYHAESDSALKEQGVLSPVLRKLRDVKGVAYDQSLNLTEETSISIFPSQYGLDQIRGIRLLPAIYQEGRDYSVEIADDHGSAQLRILDPEVFKGKEVLLALHG
jgi:hypothetical protein